MELMDRYNTLLKDNLDDIMTSIKKDIEEDDGIKEFITSKEELDKLLFKQEELLKDYLYAFKSVDKFDEKYCWNFYKDLTIPYTVVYKSLQTLKFSLMKLISEKLDKKSEILEVEKYINYLLNSIAKVYIKKDIHKLKNRDKSTFKDYLLFRAHFDWIRDLIKSIADDNLSLFPLISADRCDFNKYLRFPESTMVCIDANLCERLHDIHHLVHKSANAFYLFYKDKNYIQAYIMFKELLESIMNFNQVISELYFIAYGNAEESLFSYIEFLLFKSEVDTYLTMIDIEKLKTLNEHFGELTVNQVLKKIDGKIKKYISEDEDKFVIVKGSTADYYILSVGADEKHIKKIAKEIYKIVNDVYKINFKEIEIKSVVVTLLLNGFYEKNRDDLTKLIFHLKKDAKRDREYHFINKKKEIDELSIWLDSNYKDINFISKMLTEKSVDVVFQPIYNIDTGEVDVLEALARIKSPEGKLIPAGVFIDTIYAIGKIEELDGLILKKLIEYKKEIKMVSKTVFINVSYKSLLDGRYKKDFDKFIKEFGNKNIVFELTEQNIVENIEDIIKLHKEHGVYFAVDDFGSGYSSLKTVLDLAREGLIKELKIDETLIKNINQDEYGQKIIEIISKLADALDLKTVGEFIEHKEVLEQLKKIGITYAQGYYLSKPKLISELLVEKLNGYLNYKKKLF